MSRLPSWSARRKASILESVQSHRLLSYIGWERKLFILGYDSGDQRLGREAPGIQGGVIIDENATGRIAHGTHEFGCAGKGRRHPRANQVGVGDDAHDHGLGLYSSHGGLDISDGTAIAGAAKVHMRNKLFPVHAVDKLGLFAFIATVDIKFECRVVILCPCRGCRHTTICEVIKSIHCLLYLP